METDEEIRMTLSQENSYSSQGSRKSLQRHGAVLEPELVQPEPQEQASSCSSSTVNPFGQRQEVLQQDQSGGGVATSFNPFAQKPSGPPAVV